MSLYKSLQQREATNRPVKIGLIGAGTFGSMFLAQARRTPGMKLVGIADLDLAKATQTCQEIGWASEAICYENSAGAINDSASKGKIVLTDNAEQLIKADLDVIVESTGIAEAGTYHAWTAIEHGKHIVMVNIEADALLGQVLNRRAREKGLVYSMAYGDQPAIIDEMIDWARTIGVEVVCAGKGTRYQPEYHYSTPDTVWDYFGFSEEQLSAVKFNAKMYNSFLDGTKSAIEMCTLANASGLVPQKNGLKFPPVGVQNLANVLKPVSDGGILEHSGTVEVVASEQRDGSPIKDHLRWGVYVVFRATTEHMRRFLAMHDFVKDTSGEYAAAFRPYHLIGLELGISVAKVALRGEETGSANFFAADVASVAKKDLKKGDVLDGEGGYTVYGRLVRADDSITGKYLPMGLSRSAKLLRPVRKDSILTYQDVELDRSQLSYKIRKILEDDFKPTVNN
ncbi:MAG: Gfo/Idh/MocA family oxidoreductase [Dehalococcoidales bacterium]